MSITEAIEHMSIDELISALQEMEQLRHSPAWEVIRASLKESLTDADQMLHSVRADDLVAVAMSQATCAAIDHLVTLPAELVRRYQEQLASVDGVPDEDRSGFGVYEPPHSNIR